MGPNLSATRAPLGGVEWGFGVLARGISASRCVTVISRGSGLFVCGPPKSPDHLLSCDLLTPSQARSPSCATARLGFAASSKWELWVVSDVISCRLWNGRRLCRFWFSEQAPAQRTEGDDGTEEGDVIERETGDREENSRELAV